MTTKAETVKHTTGPWRVDLTSPYEPGDPTPYAKIDAGEGYWSQEGTGFHLSGIMDEADARLIAAAPEMLEALRNLTENIEHAFPSMAHLGPLVAANAAIAKATGADQ